MLDRVLRFLIAALSVALLAFAMASCGGDDDDDDGGDGTSPGQQTGQTGSGGGDSDLETGGKLVNACGLLRADEVEPLIGEAPETAPENTAGANPLGQALCLWGTAREDSIAYVQVSVIRQKDFASQLKSNNYTARKLFDDTKASYTTGTSPIEDVSGVGDSAYRVGDELHILDNEVTFSVAINRKGIGNAGKPPVATDELKGLARKVLDRIPD